MKRILSVFLAVLLLFSVVCIVPVAATEPSSDSGGWDGVTASIPEGDGSPENPYLIASAENLYWCVKTIGTGSAKADLGVVNPFAGKYVLQMADIDLNGKSITPMGYHYGGENVMHVFGGTYDGNGYTIKNGTITDANGNNTNANWGTGLFGTIYDATIKNVTLAHITVNATNAQTGVLVGDARGKVGNLIENCVVKDTCKITSVLPSKTAHGYGNAEGSIGGILSYASGTQTTVRNCVNGAEITIGEYILKAGGIVGSARGALLIENCVNTANIQALGDAITAETTCGGIFGIMEPAITGDVTITKCYNSGTLVIDGGPASSINYAGIMGGSNSITATNQYTISHCYNLTGSIDFGELAQSSLKLANLRVAPILGTEYGTNTAHQHIRIESCASVEWANTWNNPSSKFESSGCALFRLHSKTNITQEQGHVDHGTYDEILTEDAIKVYTDGIDAVIEAAQAALKTMRFKGYQPSITDPTTVRLLFSFAEHSDLNRYQSYGFAIAAEGIEGEITRTGTTVYGSVIGYQDGKEIPYTAADLSAAYLVPLTLRNLRNGAYTIQSYAIDRTGARINGASFRMIYTDGKVSVYPMRSITVNGTKIQDFKIVVPKNGSAELLIAETLQDYIKTYHGYELEIVTDDLPVEGVEIRVGKTSRTTADPESGRYIIQVTQNALEVVSSTVMGYGSMLNTLLYTVIPFANSDVALTAGQKWDGSEALDALPSERGQLRVMYHNILGYQMSDYPVGSRSKLDLQVYRELMPDILGLQEASKAWRESSKELLNGLADMGYTEVCFSSEGGTGNPIFYRKNVLELKASGYKRARSGDKGTTWCVFEAKETGKLFAVTNSHFAANSNANNDPVLGNEYRVQDANTLISVVNDILKEYGTIPVINGGDYNTTQSSDAYKALIDGGFQSVRGLADHVSSYSAYFGHPIYNPGKDDYDLGVYNYRAVSSAIDHIMLAGAISEMQANRYVILKDRVSCTLSDHLPHYADIDLT